MAEPIKKDEKITKSPHAMREERILAFWKEKEVFQQSLDKNKADGKDFIFYEGPPTANGRPGIHHLEARAFKDAIPRYKTMRGYYVRRKGGWDTHGLPVELQVEKQLGLKSKKEIETYGIAAFNEKCKDSVWTFVHEWEDFTNRMGYWIDLKDPYITYKPQYIESVWNIMKKVEQDGLLYKDYKVVPWCPRCGTGLSSHELAQGYEDVKDLSVTVKFKIQNSKKEKEIPTYLLAWTTTPWTLPGNAGLAVGKDIEYVKLKVIVANKLGAGEFSLEKVDAEHREVGDFIIIAKERLSVLRDQKYEIVETFKGSDLVGLEYEPLYPFIKDSVTGAEKDKLKNAFKVYAGDFVTTSDGTGIVHLAPMYGQDDFEVGTKFGLPKHHLVNDDGTFKQETGFLAGRFVKDESVAVDIIKDLALRKEGSLLFHKEKHEHSYPHCWRCHTPLIYFARDSWYIRMSSLREKLVKENESINWEPSHIKEGRFGEWLKEVKDWAISRERYWGTPLPVWICKGCKKRKVAGSVEDVSKKSRNTYYIIRHGEADSNVLGVLSADAKAPHNLTEKGRKQVEAAADLLKKIHIDQVITSPFVRTQETAAILKEKLAWKFEVKTDDRLHELNSGSWNGKKVSDFIKEFPAFDRFDRTPEHGENYGDIKKRMGDFLYELEDTYEGKTILIITHETPACLLWAAAKGLNRRDTIELRNNKEFLNNAEIKKLEFSRIPHNSEYELDLHKPYIDEVVFDCSCGEKMTRIKEVMDVWFDSGAMPFAQDHYPFRKSKIQNNNFQIEAETAAHSFEPHSGLLHKAHGYPADFICEGIDQTRGWFYTMHAIGALMGTGKAYKNVIALGLILDSKGKKMSKSLGNTVNPIELMDKYGADALRFWMYSVNQPGDSKNFDEKTVDEVVKKVFNLASNVLSFYKLYAPIINHVKTGVQSQSTSMNLDVNTSDYHLHSNDESENILDRWIIARLNQLIENVTTNLDKYVFLEPTRSIREFVADLSQWYLRRSRDRMKVVSGLDQEVKDKDVALATMNHVLLTLAKVMAPFTPFFAEDLYQELSQSNISTRQGSEGQRGTSEQFSSVHLETWPKEGKVDQKLITDMNLVREISSKGLEARMSAKINVRQPLARLEVRSSKEAFKTLLANKEFIEIIKDEINVKEVVYIYDAEDSFVLDTKLTPELKEEGSVRELIRAIQDLRKEGGLSVSDRAVLNVETNEDGKRLIDKNKLQLINVCTLSNVKFENVDGLEVVVSELPFKFGLSRE